MGMVISGVSDCLFVFSL